MHPVADEEQVAVVAAAGREGGVNAVGGDGDAVARNAVAGA